MGGSNQSPSQANGTRPRRGHPAAVSRAVHAIVLATSVPMRGRLVGQLSQEGIRVLRHAASIAALRQSSTVALTPDLALLEVGAEGIDAAAVADLRRFYPGARVVALDDLNDSRMAQACYEAGADGLVPRDLTGRALRRTLALALSGEAVFSPRLAPLLPTVPETEPPAL